MTEVDPSTTVVNGLLQLMVHWAIKKKVTAQTRRGKNDTLKKGYSGWVTFGEEEPDCE